MMMLTSFGLQGDLASSKVLQKASISSSVLPVTGAYTSMMVILNGVPLYFDQQHSVTYCPVAQNTL